MTLVPERNLYGMMLKDTQVGCCNIHGTHDSFYNADCIQCLFFVQYFIKRYNLGTHIEVTRACLFDSFKASEKKCNMCDQAITTCHGKYGLHMFQNGDSKWVACHWLCKIILNDDNIRLLHKIRKHLHSPVFLPCRTVSVQAVKTIARVWNTSMTRHRKRWDYRIDLDLFDLVQGYCVSGGQCNICGGFVKIIDFSIDRIDSERGYVADNVAICHAKCNSVKSCASHAEMVHLLSLYEKNTHRSQLEVVMPTPESIKMEEDALQNFTKVRVPYSRDYVRGARHCIFCGDLFLGHGECHVITKLRDTGLVHEVVKTYAYLDAMIERLSEQMKKERDELARQRAERKAMVREELARQKAERKAMAAEDLRSAPSEAEQRELAERRAMSLEDKPAAAPKKTVLKRKRETCNHIFV